MFRGQHLHSIDPKGRVSLPVRFREVLAARGDLRTVLTPALFDPCLQLYPVSAWEDLEKRISEQPSFDRNAQLLRRRYVSAAVECEIDRSGRILVPPHLRTGAALDGEVVFAGMGASIELWSKQRWESALALAPADEAAFKQAVEQLRL